jgi:thiol-disulfide isomerase/thioredoxin
VVLLKSPVRAALALALLLATLALSSCAGTSGSAGATAPPTAATSRPGSFPPSPVPADAPEWRAETIRGDTIAMRDFRGRITVVDFWGTWCPPCVAWLPRLVEIEKRYGHRGVAFLTVNVEPGRDRAAHLGLVRDFMERRNYTFTVVADSDSAVVRAHDIRVYPTVLVIDPNGRVCYSSSGASRDTESSLTAKLEALLAAGP